MAWFKSSSLFAAVFFVLLQNVIFVSCDSPKRDVTVFPMPDCKDSDSCQKAGDTAPNVVYAKSVANQAKDDILHFVFSTLEIPTVLMLHTRGAADATLKFNWTMLLEENNLTLANAIHFQGKTPKVVYTSAIAFTKLIEYNDLDDTANLVDYAKSTVNLWNIRRFTSSMFQRLKMDPTDERAFTFSSYNYTSKISNTTNNGNISFAFRVPNSGGRESLPPSLKFGSNETLFDLVLSNYTPSYDSSRFAVEIIAVGLTGKGMTIDESESIDDEYSPGVFRITNLLMNPADKSHSAFVQWKPVCYLATDHNRKSASKVTYYDLDRMDKRPNATEQLASSIVFGYLGKSFWKEEVVVRTTNISFGLAKDGFYTGTNYTIWSAAFGYGDAPGNVISQTVIIVIACGLGLPMLIIVFGGVYLIIRKVKKSQTYSPINTQVN